MIPSSSIKKLIRSAAKSVIVATAPYAKAIRRSVSQRIGNGKEYFSLNFRFSAGLSVLIPRITAFLSLKSWIRSRNPIPSTIQPGVFALGKNHRTTRLPAYWLSRCSTPLSSRAVNSGALVPSVKGCVWSPVTSFRTT